MNNPATIYAGRFHQVAAEEWATDATTAAETGYTEYVRADLFAAMKDRWERLNSKYGDATALHLELHLLRHELENDS